MKYEKILGLKIIKNGKNIYYFNNKNSGGKTRLDRKIVIAQKKPSDLIHDVFWNRDFENCCK